MYYFMEHLVLNLSLYWLQDNDFGCKSLINLQNLYLVTFYWLTSNDRLRPPPPPRPPPP